jgi:mTERF
MRLRRAALHAREQFARRTAAGRRRRIVPHARRRCSQGKWRSPMSLLRSAVARRFVSVGVRSGGRVGEEGAARRLFTSFASSSLSYSSLLLDNVGARSCWTGGLSTLAGGDGSEQGGLGSERGREASEEVKKEAPRLRRGPKLGSKRGVRAAIDPLTVDFLAEKGVLGGDRAAVEKWLRSSHAQSRFPSDTALPAWEWLERISSGKGWPQTRKRKGLPVPIVRQMVEKVPQLLNCDAATLQKKWNFLQTLESDGSALCGLGLRAEQAARLVSSYPQVLHKSTEALRERVIFLRAWAVEDIAKCVQRFPRIFGNTSESIERKSEVLRIYGLNAAVMLQTFPQFVGFNEGHLEEKLRFLLGSLRFAPVTLMNNPSLLSRSLDGNMRPRIALLQQLGQPLPPPPSGDRKYVKGGNLLTILTKNPSKFIDRMVEQDHPSIRYDRAVLSKELLSSAKEWAAPLIAEAEHLGLIPQPKHAQAAA